MRLAPTLLALAFATLTLCSCKHNNEPTDTPQQTDYTAVATPDFESDSARQYVAEQLAFGYRTPGDPAHERCAQYLSRTMSRWADTVIVQHFSATLPNHGPAKGQNIISIFNPKAEKRILLGAHWDSRLWADNDPDESQRQTPIPGANDGASGIAVLMELARGFAAQRPEVGIDIIFFDLEDQGTPSWAQGDEADTWCKGSQFWGKNPHIPYYQAQFGILLDMVGTHTPHFTKEYFSRTYASSLIDKVWRIAGTLGYGAIFENTNTDPITDDHYFVNTLTNIPMIDIVQNTPGQSFCAEWHTHADDLDHIDPNTLKVVGTVLQKLIYGDYGTQTLAQE